MRHLVLGLLLALSSSAPALADAKFDELSEKVVTLFERIATEIDANKPDCDKIGTVLNKHVDEDAALMKQAHDLDKTMTKDEKDAAKKKMDAKYGARMKVAKEKGKPVRACKTNPKVKAYMTKVGF